MTELRIGTKHQKGFPANPEICPCDDCVEKTEAKHRTQMHEVWPHNMPYLMRSRSGAESRGSLPPCTICMERIDSIPGGYVEITYHVYAPLVASDNIPFHHVKRSLVHNSCVARLLEERELGISRDNGTPNRHMKQLDRFIRTEPHFVEQLSKLID